ncbi:MAG TPA: hypothetical protein V6D22_16885 [Candidatus Obscuribacterales bacterium]
MPIVEGNQAQSASFDPAVQGQAVSPYQQVLKKYENDENKETIQAIDDIIRAAGQERTTQIVNEVNQRRIVERALDHLGDELDRIIESDETLGKFRKPIELLVKSEFDTADGNTEHLENAKKLFAGTLGKPEIKAMVKKHLNELVGEDHANRNTGLSGMKTEGTGQAAAQAAAQPAVTSRKGLNDPQRALYDAKLHEWLDKDPRDRERLGIPKTDDEIRQRCLEYAASKFKEGLAD